MTPAPSDQFYRLAPTAPTAPETAAVAGHARPLLEGTLSVDRISGDALQQRRPLVFTSHQQPHVLMQHRYHYWSDVPTVGIQKQLASFLRSARVADVVVTPEQRVRIDYQVTGHIERLERVLGEGRPEAVVELELALAAPRDSRLLWTGRYRAEREAESTSVADGVAAINAALGEIFARFAEDLARSSPRRSAGLDAP